MSESNPRAPQGGHAQESGGASRSERPTVNALTVKLSADPEDPPGYRNRARRLAPLLAARALGVPVVMVARPQQASGPVLNDPADVMAFLFRHQRSLLHQETLAPREV